MPAYTIPVVMKKSARVVVEAADPDEAIQKVEEGGRSRQIETALQATFQPSNRPTFEGYRVDAGWGLTEVEIDEDVDVLPAAQADVSIVDEDPL